MRVSAIVAILLIPACGGGNDAGTVLVNVNPTGLIDAGADDAPLAAAPTYPLPCADVYAQDLLPTFSVDVSAADWAGLEDEYQNWQARQTAGLPDKPYHPIVFHYGNETITNAEMRLHGNPCCSWTGAKMQFQISFDEIDARGRFHGLRKLVLDAPPYNPSFLRDRVAFSILRDVGLPASCVNNARLVVNGAYYGVYTNIEKVDKEFLSRNFADVSGGLFKDGVLERPTGADTSRYDAYRFSSDLATIEALSDVDESMLEWAVEMVAPDGDGYTQGTNKNYYLYDHPQRGLLFIPWDWDYGFDLVRSDADPVTYLDPPWDRVRPQFWAVLADPTWFAKYLDTLGRVLAAYDPAVLAARVDTWAAQIADAAAQDPTKPFSTDTHVQAVAALRASFAPRAAFLASWLSCRTGGGTDADGDGHAWCDDCDDGNAARYPGATETCDGVDQDCSQVADDVPMCGPCIDASFGGKRYAFCTTAATWPTALATCQAQGGALAVPTTPAEETWMLTHASAAILYAWWIGANDRTLEGSWVDALGAQLSYLPWGALEPTGGPTKRCVVLDPALAAWNDAPCDVSVPFVCQLP